MKMFKVPGKKAPKKGGKRGAKGNRGKARQTEAEANQVSEPASKDNVEALRQETSDITSDPSPLPTSEPVPEPSCVPPPKIVILDPDNPQLSADGQLLSTADPGQVLCEEGAEDSKQSRWKVGFKKVLGSLSGLTGKLNTLILKFVSTVFPWNRRAKRRLAGIGAEDEDL